VAVRFFKNFWTPAPDTFNFAITVLLIAQNGEVYLLFKLMH
jgi:hypothetical protein